MAQGKTNIIGLTDEWRPAAGYDSYRVQVYKDGRPLWISSKIHPTLQQINSYLKANKLTHETALLDPHLLGLKSRLHQEESTKTFVGTIRLPLIQPSKPAVIDVCNFLKAHLDADHRIVLCHPRTVSEWWRKIAKQCSFRFISPHDWKHTYATLGAQNLHQWYQGNGYLLQQCCLHKKYETTLQYINQTADTFLGAFAPPAEPSERPAPQGRA